MKIDEDNFRFVDNMMPIRGISGYIVQKKQLIFILIKIELEYIFVFSDNAYMEKLALCMHILFYLQITKKRCQLIPC